MALTGPITLGGAALIQSDGSTGSTISGGISLGANALTINTDGGATQTINTTAITGTGGSLLKSGGGTLILGAANTYSGNTTVSAGTLTLADNAQLKFVLGATSGTNNSLTGAGTTTLNGDFVIDTTAADALATGTWTLENVTTSNYDTTFSVVGFVDAGSNTWTKDVSPNKRYTFDEATGVLTLAPAGNYASWANDPLKGNIPGELPADDFDKDGISNIVEYALGQNPRVSTQPAGVLSGNIITYTKGADAIANGDVSWVIETSQTLAPGSWTAQVTQPAADPALTIAYTFTPGSPVKNFARLKVTQLP
jgi:autotransporter-associated beta strand protein